MAKDIMREIGEAMQKLLYKKKEKPPIKPVQETPPSPVDEDEQLSPWRKATDVDAKMRKKMKEAGID